MYIKTANSGAAVDLTGTTSTTFFLYDLENDTYKLEDDTSGVTNSADTTGVITKEWSAANLDTAAWFTYERGTSKVETTTSVEVNVVNPWENVEG
jgi:hypothetical protein